MEKVIDREWGYVCNINMIANGVASEITEMLGADRLTELAFERYTGRQGTATKGLYQLDESLSNNQKRSG